MENKKITNELVCAYCKKNIKHPIINRKKCDYKKCNIYGYFYFELKEVQEKSNGK